MSKSVRFTSCPCLFVNNNNDEWVGIDLAQFLNKFYGFTPYLFVIHLVYL